jgi:hypothetical protein
LLAVSPNPNDETDDHKELAAKEKRMSTNTINSEKQQQAATGCGN